MATDPKTAGMVMIGGGSLIEIVGVGLLLYGLGIVPDGGEGSTVMAGMGGFILVAGNLAILAGVLAMRSAR